jgi:hypothetical protein
MPTIDEAKRVQLLEKYARLMQEEIESIESGSTDQAEALKGLYGVAYANKKRALVEQQRAEERRAARAEAEARVQAEQADAEEQAATGKKYHIPGDYVSMGPAVGDLSIEASYAREKSRIKQGDINALTTLKAKYRRMGLDVW